MLGDFVFLNDLDRALDISLPVQGNPDLTERAFSQDAADLVPVFDVLDLLKAFEVLEIEHVLVALVG